MARPKKQKEPVTHNKKQYPTWIIVSAGLVYSACLLQRPAFSIPLFLIMFLLIDVCSGFVHVTLDNPRNLKTFLKGMAEGFQKHHDNPQSIYEMSWYSHMAPMTLPWLASAAFGFTYHFLKGNGIFYTPLINSALYSGFWLAMMQASHRWAHLPAKDRWVSILPPSVHHGHHQPPYDKNFCLLGPMNPVFNFMTKHLIHQHSHFYTVGLAFSILTPYLII